MSDLNANIPVPNSPLLRQDGRITEVWWRFFLQLFDRTGGTSGTDPATVFVGLDVDAPLALVPPTEQIGLETLHAVPLGSVEGVVQEALLASVQAQFMDFHLLMGNPSQNVAQEPMIFPVDHGQSAQAPAAITVTASPMSYVCSQPAALHLAGGAVSALSYSRAGVSLALDVAATGQLIEMSAGDMLEITYSSAPTLTLIPR